MSVVKKSAALFLALATSFPALADEGKGVEPMAHPLPLVNVLRDDVVAPSVDREEVLSQAPSVEDNRFMVPRILGEAS